MTAPTLITPDGSQPSLLAVVGFLIGVATFGIVIWDRVISRGKSLQKIDGKIDDLCEQVNDLEGKLTVVDGLSESVRDLLIEWQGKLGNNGYKSIIKENSRRLGEIEKRNWKIDAVREAHEADLRRSGGLQRRESDRSLNNLMPEDREEKP